MGSSHTARQFLHPMMGSACWWLGFDGVTSAVSCGTDSNLANLPLNAAGFTYDGWVYAIDYGEGGYGHIISKGSTASPGWRYFWYTGVGVEFRIFFNTAAFSRVAYLPDGAWHHMAGYLNPADMKIYLARDGTWAAAYVLQSAGVAPYASDAAVNLALGARGTGLVNSLNGRLGWQRLSVGNLFGYPTNFTAPIRCAMPTVTPGTTLEVWPVDEGGGSTTRVVIDSGDVGALTACTWGNT